MPNEELSVSLETLIEVSPLLGSPLQDRAHIRAGQDMRLVQALQAETELSLANPEHQKLFFYGSLDFLVYERDGQKRFQPIEMNGTNMAGVTNIHTDEVRKLLNELSRVPTWLTDTPSVFLVPFSGTQSLATSGSQNMTYERILYAQAIKEGFQKLDGAGKIMTLPEILQSQIFTPSRPTVVLGFLKDIIPHLSVQYNRLCFKNIPVAGSYHDTFLDQIHGLFPNQIDPARFFPLNAVYPVTADKGRAYQAVNQLLALKAFGSVADPINFAYAYSREELIETVLRRVNGGDRLVIKPHAAGLGRGVEFFVKPESEATIIDKIDQSIHSTERFYSSADSGFPYSIADFIDCCAIDDPNHPQYGHKYELRIFVYRVGNTIQAFPSIAKIASQPYDSERSDRLMLLNNVAVSASNSKKPLSDYVLPLSNDETLAALQLTREHLADLCRFSTHFVSHIIQQRANELSQPSCKSSSTSNLVS